VAAVDARDRGVDRAGVLGGVWTAGETAGLALGPTLVLGILAVTGFVSRTGDALAAQPPSALTGIVVAFSVLPAALAFLSLLPLARYPLSESVVDAPPVTPSKESRS
jgi:glycoside/pentoside/hexuronide:cation symporter, GPH family